MFRLNTIFEKTKKSQKFCLRLSLNQSFDKEITLCKNKTKRTIVYLGTVNPISLCMGNTLPCIVSFVE